jgi:hydroxyethylthiazole kinase
MNADLARQAADILERVRGTRPRVHCLMNTVVQKFTADGISVVGAIPSMTSSVEEVEAFVDRADALTVNLGTLDKDKRHAIKLAVDVAAAQAKPWIVDPVHIDYSASRLAFARTLLARVPSCVRGNAAEMQALGDLRTQLHIRTGPSDLLSKDGSAIHIDNGHPWMAMVTGTGCLSGGIIAAFMAVETDPLAASAAALLVVGVSAELAAEHSRGPGTFGIALLDAIASISEADIVSRARISHEQG